MTDYTFEIRVVDETMLFVWIDLMQRFPQMMPLAAQKIADKHRQSILSFFTQVPGSPVSPWPWVSERQKVAFMMTDGFGGGIPHQRGGADSLEEQVKVDVTYGSEEALAEIVVHNDAVNSAGLPIIDFVEGFKQQPGFAQTGWFGPEAAFNFMAEEENAMWQDFLDFTNQAMNLQSGGGL